MNKLIKCCSLFLCAITFNMHSQNSLTPIDSALIACYPFSGNANDLSGNGNNGTVNGAVLVNDRFNNPNSAYSFNGTNQNITVSNFSNLITTNEVSISFWSTSTIYATRSAFIFVSDDPTNRFNVHVYYGNSLANSQTIWDFGNISNNGRLSINSSPLPAANVWDHWVFVSSQTGYYMKCYKNGVLQYTKPSSSTFSNASLKDLLIGGGLGVSSAYLWFDGKLDDVRIYKRVLTQNDVTNLYSNNISCINCPAALTPTNTTDLNQNLCVGNGATLSVASSPTVNWYSSTSSTVVLGSGTTFITPSYSAAGVYTFYARASNNCTLSGAVAISFTVNALPVIQTTSTHSLICLGETTTISASGCTSYTWDPGSSVSNSMVVSPVSNTTYTVNAIGSNGCSNTALITVYVSACTGLVNLNGENVSYNIFPNPAKEKVNVGLSVKIETEVKVEVIDIDGKVVQASNLIFTRDKNSQQLDLTSVSTGSYFISLSTKNGKPKLIKLVKE